MIKILSVTYTDSTYGGPYRVAIDHKNSLEKEFALQILSSARGSSVITFTMFFLSNISFIILSAQFFSSAIITIDGIPRALPYIENYWHGDNVTISAQIQQGWLFEQWQSNTNPFFPSTQTLSANFNAVNSSVLPE